MTELIKQNSSPINQLAKKHLQEVNPDFLPNLLYSLQLGQWALDKGEVVVNDDRPLAEELDRLLLEVKPIRAQRYFLEDQEDTLVRQAKDKNPVEVAQLLLQHLDSVLTEKVKDYPRALDLPAHFR